MAHRTPSLRAVVVACAAVVVLGAAAVVGITAWADGSGPTAGGTPSGTATSRAASAPTGTGAGTAGSTARPGAGGLSAPATPGASAATPATAPSEASELSPGTPQTLPTQPPPTPAPTRPSLTGPLPATGSERGTQLVAGFPVQVVPVLDGITVVSSSVSGQGNRLQVGMEASSSADPATVTSRYVAAFSKEGFTATAAAALPGSTATRFTRGADGIVLTVTHRVGGGTELTIAATLTTSG